MDRLDEWIEAMRAAGSEDGELFGFFKELRAAREELAELRALAAGSYTVGWTWRDGEPVPDDYLLHDEDGDPVDLAVDASGLVQAVLDRQAATWVRAAELTPAAVPLEQLLALVPSRYVLASRQTDAGYLAWWHLGQAGILVEGSGLDLVAAIRAATIALLRGRQKCGTCAHWGSHGDEGGGRECQADEHHYRRTAGSSCPDGWRPARWLRDEPELPVSPARLVRAALAYVDSIPFPGAGPELELWQAAAELRGIEPGDGEGGQ